MFATQKGLHHNQRNRIRAYTMFARTKFYNNNYILAQELLHAFQDSYLTLQW